MTEREGDTCGLCGYPVATAGALCNLCGEWQAIAADAEAAINFTEQRAARVAPESRSPTVRRVASIHGVQEGSALKAIETEYKGYRFRSRLEARWAVFFDAAGIEWKYEPEGYEVNVGSPEEPNIVRWLPDFYLPHTKTWVEVKGSDEAMKADWSRMATILDFNSPVPGMADSFTHHDRGVLLLGDIPSSDFGVVFHPLIQHRKGLWRTFGLFFSAPGGGGFIREPGDGLLRGLMGVPTDEHGADCSDILWSTKSFHVRTQLGYRKVIDAYRAARGARFEHGERGRAA